MIVDAWLELMKPASMKYEPFQVLSHTHTKSNYDGNRSKITFLLDLVSSVYCLLRSHASPRRNETYPTASKRNARQGNLASNLETRLQ